MNINNCSDEELVLLIHAGDSYAETILYERYWGIAKVFGAKMAKIYSNVSISADDFTSVAFTSVYIAVQKFTKSCHSFYSFWLTIARNECTTFIGENVVKGTSAFRPISLDRQLYYDGLTLHETMGQIDDEIFREIDQHEIIDYIFSKKNNLSDNEAKAAYYIIVQGCTFDDLAEITKWDKRKVYRVVSSMKIKVSNFIKSRYFDI